MLTSSREHSSGLRFSILQEPSLQRCRQLARSFWSPRTHMTCNVSQRVWQQEGQHIDVELQGPVSCTNSHLSYVTVALVFEGWHGSYPHFC